MPQVSPILTRDALATLPFEIGDYTYGAPKIHWWGEAAVLKIGKFCSIAEGVQIFVGGNHRTDWITTYPFSAIAHWPEAQAIEGHPATRGDVVIGHDVWIAADAMILSGVTIGNGAVIGAGAVVRENVPAYAIVTGNPAKVARYRFEPGTVALLQSLQWWNFEEDRIRGMIPYLMSGDIVSLLAFTHPEKGQAEPRTDEREASERSAARVFDCIIYNGEADILQIRLNELTPAIDIFVIVEASLTFSGRPRQKVFDEEDSRFSSFKHKIRHILVKDMPDTDNPWIREAWQRDAVMRGIQDAAPDDLIILSDADEIPRLSTVSFMIDHSQHDIYAMGLRLSFFYFNYCNIAGPVVQTVWNSAVRRRVLDRLRPDQIRTGVRTGNVPAVIIQKAGWHFSYLMDESGIKQKIKSFSHQEYNTEEFLSGISIKNCIRYRTDLFGDKKNIWDIVDHDMPKFIDSNKEFYEKYFIPDDMRYK